MATETVSNQLSGEITVALEAHGFEKFQLFV